MQSSFSKRWLRSNAGCGGRVGYIVTIAVHFFLYWFINKIPKWDWWFITDAYETVLPFIEISVIANIIAFAVFLIIDIRPIYYIGKTILDSISFFVLFKMYHNFPVDFNNGWNIVFKIVLIVGMVGTVISLIVRTFKLAANKKMD